MFVVFVIVAVASYLTGRASVQESMSYRADRATNVDHEKKWAGNAASTARPASERGELTLPQQPSCPVWLRTGAVLSALVMLAVFASTAAASHHRKHHQAAVLKIAVKPATVEAGGGFTVSGRILHADPRHLGGYRVELQEKQGKKFATLAGSKPDGKGEFTENLTAPTAAGTVLLRLRLSLHKREVDHTKDWSLSVRVKEGGGHGEPPRSQSTLVLDPQSILSVPEPGQPGQVRVSGNPNVQTGDIIAIGIGPGSPDGFLGRVTSVKTEGAVTVLETVPATLPEALPEGEFSQEIEAEEFEVENSEADELSAVAAGAHARSTGPKGSLQAIPVRDSFSCNGGATVTVNGAVSIKPSIDIGGGWSPFGGVHAHFIGKASASTELSARADGSASCNAGPFKLFTKTLQPIAFSVGPIPVVVVPVISAFLSADGNVEVAVESEVHGSITAEAGIEYAHGQASPVGHFDKDFGWSPPEPEGNAHLEAKVSPTLDLLVYGVGGPEVQFNAGLALDANLFEDPAWTLTAPVSLTAKLAIPALDISTGTLTVYQHTFPLAQAGETAIQGLIHFDEYPEGTVITNQYANVGVVFDSPVFITEDGSNPTSPVLSGEPLFEGPIEGHFVKPGTNTPTTVNLLQLDAGYINNPGSVEIVAHLANGNTRTAIANHLAIDQISISARGIESFTVQEVGEEDAGFAIDNLGFGS
jgi:hypothetical protein